RPDDLDRVDEAAPLRAVLFQKVAAELRYLLFALELRLAIRLGRSLPQDPALAEEARGVVGQHAVDPLFPRAPCEGSPHPLARAQRAPSADQVCQADVIVQGLDLRDDALHRHLEPARRGEDA